MRQTYSVTVPRGLQPGQQFQASLGGQLSLITVPQNSRGTSTIYVQQEINESRDYSVIVPNNIVAGQSFTANMGGRIIWVSCPYGKGPGDQIIVNNGIEELQSRNINTISNRFVEWPIPLDIPEQFDYIEIPKHFVCPITECIMRQPAITPYGITYEYDAIVKWLETKQIDPATNKSLMLEQLYSNRSLRNMIEEFVSTKTLEC